MIVFASSRASVSLHADTMRRVIYAPMAWHDATPAGRILSRFSSDLTVIDMRLSASLNEASSHGPEPRPCARPLMDERSRPRADS